MRTTLTFMSFAMISMITGVTATTAQAGEVATSMCYLQEEDPATKKTFVSHERHAQELARWNSVPRPSVGPIDLAIAYATYRKAKPHAETLTTDKAMHCYIGCVISVATSAKVTDYVGWLKERQDLTDCNRGTHFEDADMIATSRGARLGARDNQECEQLCTGEFARTRKPSAKTASEK